MKKNQLAILSSAFAQIVHKETGTHTINATRTLLPSGVQVFQAVVYPNTSVKADRAPMLSDLTKFGFTQKASAQALNISTSYASKLLKREH